MDRRRGRGDVAALSRKKENMTYLLQEDFFDLSEFTRNEENLKGNQNCDIGTISELQFMVEAAKNGFTVFTPIGHSQKADVVIWKKPNKPISVQIKKGLFEREEISGFKFNSKTKQDLWDYMTKVVDKKTGATAYQKDSIDKGPEARYIFAYLMKNNWDASKLEKNLKNKVVSEVKKKLSNYSDGRSKIKSGTSREEKEQTNSFAGFRKLAV